MNLSSYLGVPKLARHQLCAPSNNLHLLLFLTQQFLSTLAPIFNAPMIVQFPQVHNLWGKL